MDIGTSGRAGQHVQGVVIHRMNGSLGSTDDWFKQPRSGVSAHFGIGYSGEIHQYVNVLNTAWANGIWQLPANPRQWLADAKAKGINPNLLTVSIELEGFFTQF